MTGATGPGEAAKRSICLQVLDATIEAGAN